MKEISQDQISSYLVRRYTKQGCERHGDRVAVEEPLEIRIGFRFKDARHVETVAVTMRTPGNEKELTAGFLLSEGIITRIADITEIRRLGTHASNEVLAELADGVDVDEWRLRRATILNSACGLCGKRSIDALADAAPLAGDEMRLNADMLYAMPELLRKQQLGFGVSGGLHAAALFSAQADVIATYEDIGRHNALDKLIGHCLFQGLLPLSGSVLFMSSRGSFELVQKALAAGAPVLATIGAPSSLAIEYARSRAMTLIGFVRSDHFNVYSGEWRIA